MRKACFLFALSIMLFADEIRILPIDRAKFLAGQKFDFLVEVKDRDHEKIRVLVNKVKAEDFFKKQSKVWSENGVNSYRIDQITFPKAGKVQIEVIAGDQKRQVSYDVVHNKAPKVAKNVILLIGDGMSLQAKQMARIISKGIKEGKYNDLLEMEKLDRLALITTSGYDSLTTDSANSASAYATGHKSVVNAMGVYEDSTQDPFDDPKVENISEILRRTTKKSIGFVTTANITDATPAAFLVHTRRRYQQNFIALSFLDQQPDVLLGGGLRQFIPKGQKGSKRDDNQNLLELYRKAGYSLSFNKKELLEQKGKANKLLGLYHLNNLNVHLDRAVLKNKKTLGEFTDQPSLLDMTKVALETLSNNKDGFFLMIEGASIDKQLHTMDWQRAAYDTIEFDQSVKLAKQFADKNKDTLVIVVADHAHGASITGTYHELDGKKGREAVRIYEDSIFPNFQDLDQDGFPDNPDPDITLAIQYSNHPDYKANYRFQNEPISPTIEKDGKYIANPNIEGEEYKGNIPISESTETHAADDVVLMADGVGSEYFKGVMDNTEVFFGIVRALGLDARK